MQDPSKQSIEAAINQQKAEILSSLPPPEDLLLKAIKYCMHKIHEGVDAPHYQKCLARAKESYKKRNPSFGE